MQGAPEGGSLHSLRRLSVCAIIILHSVPLVKCYSVFYFNPRAQSGEQSTTKTPPARDASPVNISDDAFFVICARRHDFPVHSISIHNATRARVAIRNVVLQMLSRISASGKVNVIQPLSVCQFNKIPFHSRHLSNGQSSSLCEAGASFRPPRSCKSFTRTSRLTYVLPPVPSCV